jgi:hypothetical protein
LTFWKSNSEENEEEDPKTTKNQTDGCSNVIAVAIVGLEHSLPRRRMDSLNA